MYDESMTTEVMRLQDILDQYSDGDEIGWHEEFEYLRIHNHDRLARLAGSIAVFGQITPVDLGHDGRVWDGHHRLCILQSLDYKYVLVRYV